MNKNMKRNYIVIICVVLLVLSPYLPFLTGDGKTYTVMTLLSYLGIFAQFLLILGGVIFLLLQLTHHPKLSLIGCIIEGIVVLYLFSCSMNAVGYGARLGLGFFVMMISFIMSIIMVFKKG